MEGAYTRRDFLSLGAAAGLTYAFGNGCAGTAWSTESADLILLNGRFATMSETRPFAEAVSLRAGRFSTVGSALEVMREKGPETRLIDVKGGTVIPGLNDSHTHPIRGGLNYDLELRWDGVPSLADALRLLREQARRTPPPHWVRVVGGWTEFQFEERRMPTLDEINAVAPDTPVFVLHLYDRAWLNGAALRAVGYTRETPEPPGGQIQRDKRGNPTGLLIARPNAWILYSTLAKAPKLSFDEQLSSTRRFMRELNRLGITSVVDAGGGFQSYPDDYEVIDELARRGQLTTRIAYNLFTQHPQEELSDFSRWTELVRPGQGDDFHRVNGAGEMLVYSAADFEDFLEPRPELAATMERDLTAVVAHLAKSRWPFRLHATYDETITRALDVFETVNREVPLEGLRWFIDHAETISPRNIERVKALGGGIAVQDRMAFQGEYFVERYGAKAAEACPPIKRMLQTGVPVGAGTDATRVSSYNPFFGLYWLVTGKTLGGLTLSSDPNRLGRLEALRLWTVGSAWFSGEDGKKGRMARGQLGDLAVLSADYFSVPDDQIKSLESVLTIVGGRVVHASGDFAAMAPPALPGSPSWTPVTGGTAASRRLSGSGPSETAAAATHAHTPASWSCGCFAF
jgi:predicted amidohydrolase YtcJ